MGLDMYLHKKTYVKNWNHMSKEEKHQITVKKGGKVRKDIKPERISEITEQVGYWRKFNALHNWFVQNCQGGRDECQETYVSEEKLKELLDALKTIAAADAKTAKKVLPTASGFFFGGTDYDEYYFQDVKETIVLLEELLKEEGDYYYRASW